MAGVGAVSYDWLLLGVGPAEVSSRHQPHLDVPDHTTLVRQVPVTRIPTREYRDA
jgi:hypothetical protein